MPNHIQTARILKISPETEARFTAAGFFRLSTAWHDYAWEYHFEDHAERGRDLRVFDTGVALLAGPYNGSGRPDLQLGAIRVDNEQQLLEFCEAIGWLEPIKKGPPPLSLLGK